MTHRVASASASVLALLLLAAAPLFAQGTVVFDSIPAPTPPNVASLGYECCSVLEFGDEIRLEVDTPRRTGYATLMMSSWALHSDYPSMPVLGYPHSLTLSIYADSASAAAHTPVKTVTQEFIIPWRPEANPTCPGGTAWRFDETHCYNGFAFSIMFDLRSLNYDLPEQFIYGIAFNTNTSGYSPLGAPGPYNSLNVGLNTNGPVAVGTDVDPDVVYVNYSNGGFYSDLGAGSVGTFRPDTNWSGYVPTVQFATFALPTTTASCKNGAWQNLVRSDFSAFKNQGACVAYVNTGK